MAVTEAVPEQPLDQRFRELLRRARSHKQSVDIEPILQVSALAVAGEPLFPSHNGKESHNLAVEHAAKDIFYDYLTTFSIHDEEFINIWNLLDIVQYLGDRKLCMQQLVLLLLEELLDSQSLDGCRYAFRFLESRRDILTAEMTQNENLVILRLCNELLRRLSQAEDPVFCGQVYIFLFQSFPLCYRSSVNLRGKFHVENITTFENYLQQQQDRDDTMADASQMESKDTNGATPTDQKLSSTSTAQVSKDTLDIDALYPVFWSLQQFFSDPPRLFEKEAFEAFRKGIEATLAKFKDMPQLMQTKRNRDDLNRKGDAEIEAGDDYDDDGNVANPKYLTSRDLFKLELSDLAFQRHILVQSLIMIDFVLTLTEKAKQKPYYQDAQKMMQYNLTLSDEDTEWALGIKTAIANYLQDGPDGKIYYRMVDTVLSRDKNWVRWKMENCKSFERDRIPAKDVLESKSGALKAVAARKAPKPTGTPANLRFLSEKQPDGGLTRLKDQDRFTAPDVQTYAELVRAMEGDIAYTESSEDTRNLGQKTQSCTWRALRIASRDQLSSFDTLEHGKGLGRLFGPAALTSESTRDARESTAPEDRDSVPPPEHQSVEELRPDQQSQVTVVAAAE